jgi:hypothetical protein
MPEEEFYRHARYIHSQSLSLPEGSNRQAMFFNLWQWCLHLHRGGLVGRLLTKIPNFYHYFYLLAFF